jgi:hypothetical protein
MPVNMVALTSKIGKSKLIRLTTSLTPVLTNVANSNEIFRINSITAINHGVITTGVTIQLVANNTTYNLAQLLQVPTRTNVLLIDRDMGLCLEEGIYIQASASINNTLSLLISYDVIVGSTPSNYTVTSIIPNTNYLTEGSTVNLTVTTANISSANLYWSASGTVSDSDFFDSISSNVFTVTNNNAVISVRLNNDAQFEGSESFVVVVKPGPDSAVTLATSSIINVAETTLPISQSTTQVVENGLRTISYSVPVSPSLNGTLVYWNNIGNFIPNDFKDNVWFGTSTVANGRANIDVELSSSFDYANTSKTITLQVRSDNIFGPVQATAIPVTTAKYIVSTSVYSVARGGSVTFTANTTNVPDNSIVYWKNEGSTNASDFTLNANEGTLIVSNNTASLALTVNNNARVEEEETIKIVLRVDSQTGYIVGVSPTVLIPSEYGEALYSTVGTYSWLAPTGISSVTAVCVGGGGGGNYGPNTNPGSRAGGGGGALAWRNGIGVTAGSIYTIVVGAGGTQESAGAASYFISSGTVQAGGGGAGTSGGTGGSGGTVSAPASGGAGGAGGGNASTAKGAGGAGGYSGAGGSGATGGAGAGGGGGGSIASTINEGWGSPGGGGVNVYGLGTNGFGGASPPGQPAQTYYRGGGGSGGNDGIDGSQSVWGDGGVGGLYGGGGGYGVQSAWGGSGGRGGNGAVRIIWGPSRSFPSTNVGPGSYTP